MIADLKPYAQYKESGSPWLGRVPGHWHIRRLKTSVANVIELTAEMKSNEVYVALEHVESWTGRVWPQSDEGHFCGQVKRFRPADVLFGKLRPYLAKVAQIGRDGVCAGEFFVLRVEGDALSPAYLGHQLRAKHTIDAINGSTFGAKMPRADWHFLGNLSISMPPPDEQAAIVRFLDWATNRLDRASRAKRKVIALLNEQKQAIIHRAVTRGLDPSIPLKDSGVPWLGEIPKHWEVVPPKRVLRSRSSGTAPIKNTASDVPKTGFVPAFSASGQDVWLPEPMFHGPGLVLSAVGARCGKTFKASGAWGVVANTHVLLVRAPHSREYWWYVTNSEAWWERAGAAQPFVQVSKSLDRKWVVPPPAEQAAIVARLDEELLGISVGISRLEREIMLLREYRTRLVADVVTGKLDVRAAAAALPDKAPLDDATASPDSDDDALDTDPDDLPETEGDA